MNKENRDCVDGAVTPAAVVRHLNKCLLYNADGPQVEQKAATEDCIVGCILSSRIIRILSLPERCLSLMFLPLLSFFICQ